MLAVLPQEKACGLQESTEVQRMHAVWKLIKKGGSGVFCLYYGINRSSSVVMRSLMSGSIWACEAHVVIQSGV